MAGQAPSRRHLLQALASASLASAAPGFVRWSFAFAEPQSPSQSPSQNHVHHHTASPATRAAIYRPQFFTPPEYHLLSTLAELILPSTAASPPSHTSAKPHAPLVAATAGATDAGVAEFIDFMVSHDPTLQAVFRPGLAWLDTASAPSGFLTLATAGQTALLTRLAYKQHFRPGETTGQQIFALMRKYTVMGFYTSRIGLESLNYPGLTFYAESPSVPNDGSLTRLGVHA